MKITSKILTVAGSILVSSLGSAQVNTATYIGNDRVWNNPANWSTGTIPGIDYNIIIDGKDVDVEYGTYKFEDLIISSFGSVTTKPGVIWNVQNETINNGRLIHQSTNGTGANSSLGSLTIFNPTNAGFGTFKLNPTPKSKRTILLQSSAQVDFGLGGTTASSATQMGSGTYATLTAETISLGGTLSLSSYYGFLPTAGQQFQIISSTRTLTGQFTGLQEGSIAGQLGGVPLRISYVGGDGNDVVLTAVPEPATMIALAGALGVMLKTRRGRKS